MIDRMKKDLIDSYLIVTDKLSDGENITLKKNIK